MAEQVKTLKRVASYIKYQIKHAAVFRTQETLEEGKVEESFFLIYNGFRALWLSLSHLQNPPIYFTHLLVWNKTQVVS